MLEAWKNSKCFFMIVVVVATSLAVARFLLTEVHDFWIFLQHLQWRRPDRRTFK
jgi:hypothetical protein